MMPAVSRPAMMVEMTSSWPGLNSSSPNVPLMRRLREVFRRTPVRAATDVPGSVVLRDGFAPAVNEPGHRDEEGIADQDGKGAPRRGEERDELRPMQHLGG